jgi:hypothetical protein
MSYWCSTDKCGFTHVSNFQQGQINMNSKLGNFIYNISLNENYTYFLEVGTWNGLGSTKCFIEGLNKRNKEYKFYSLECNQEKCEFAQKLYQNYNNVHILNEVLLNRMPDDIYEIFPEILANSDFKYWNDIDYKNMENKKLFLDRNDIPNIFDVILLDGGEFTTWYEFQVVKDKCKILLLDDTNTFKCKKILSLLQNDENWNCLFISDERNGTAAFSRNI